MTMFLLSLLTIATATSCTTTTTSPSVVGTTLQSYSMAATFGTAVSCVYSKGNECASGGKAGAVVRQQNKDPYSDPQDYIASVKGLDLSSLSEYFNTTTTNVVLLRVAAASTFIVKNGKLPDYCNLLTSSVDGVDSLSCSTSTNPGPYINNSISVGCSATQFESFCIYFYCSNATAANIATSYWYSNAVGLYTVNVDRSFPAFILPSTSFTTSGATFLTADSTFLFMMITSLIIVVIVAAS